ncbi:MAG TPA: DUF58 domain-containing protein [Opitutaceae bacterium]|nr:DUF58 domain-containing protein [Opitutaceae bacterium]
MAFAAPKSAVPPPLPRAVPPPLLQRIGYVPPTVRRLDVAELAALQTLPLRARWLAEAVGLGRHRSHRRGSDLEFADYRDYQYGDDLRRIDWRVYARTDRLHIRRAHADTPLRLVLLLDVSASMVYTGERGRTSKIDYARAALGALALIARRQRDPCGAGLLGETLAHWLPPGGAAAKLESVWQLLDRPELGGSTDLCAALEQVLAVAPSRCLFVLASDFYVEPAKLAPVLLHLHGEGHEFVALRVLDPVETDFPFTAASRFADIEEGTQLAVDPAAAAKAYRAEFAQHAAALEELVVSHGGDWLPQLTNTLPLDVLRAYLGQRSRRR